MTWNYRVTVEVTHDEPVYGIREVYYDPEGRITAWSHDLMRPHGDDLSGLIADHAMMAVAFGKPVLDLAKLEASL